MYTEADSPQWLPVEHPILALTGYELWVVQPTLVGLFPGTGRRSCVISSSRLCWADDYSGRFSNRL